jgi:citrate lyase subunit beta/citryl-CoA lyase
MELDHHLDAIETANALPRGATKVLAVAESLAAVRAACYRGAPSRLIGLCFGAEGLGAEFGVAPRGPDGSYRAPLLQARNDLLVAAAQAGVAAIDAPFPDSLDVEGLGREIHAAANDGFAGKICLHPSQVAAITAAFTASPERAEWARRIKRAFDAAPDRDVLTLDGSLIDRLQLGVAERILSAFE